MLIVMDSQADAETIRRVIEKVEQMGLKATPIPGAQRVAIGITGNRGTVDPTGLENLPGVLEIIPVSAPYKLVSRESKRENSVVSIRGVEVGGEKIVVGAGPCAVESEEQTIEIARRVAAAGASLLRGGAYKPRSSPYSFQGLGLEGLKILAKAREETGLPIVTEVLDTETAEEVAEYADCLQIGARNMQNFSLLKKVGRLRKPVLLEGNYDVILCERGVRTFAAHTRNTLDLSSIPAVQRISHLPIVADPSHGTGKRHKVIPLSRAAVAVGADGLLIEVHHKPETALSDGPQALLPEQFADLMNQVRALSVVMGRSA